MPDSDEPGIIHFTFAAPERIRSFGCGSLLVYCLNRCLFFCSFGREGAEAAEEEIGRAHV